MQPNFLEGVKRTHCKTQLFLLSLTFFGYLWGGRVLNSDGNGSASWNTSSIGAHGSNSGDMSMREVVSQQRCFALIGRSSSVWRQLWGADASVAGLWRLRWVPRCPAVGRAGQVLRDGGVSSLHLRHWERQVSGVFFKSLRGSTSRHVTARDFLGLVGSASALLQGRSQQWFPHEEPPHSLLHARVCARASWP